MTWHTVAAAEDEFQVLLGSIRREGGVITHSRPCATGFTRHLRHPRELRLPAFVVAPRAG